MLTISPAWPEFVAQGQRNGFDVGFEARAMRPFAGSQYDSDESIGLVKKNTLYNGGMLNLKSKRLRRFQEEDWLK